MCKYCEDMNEVIGENFYPVSGEYYVAAEPPVRRGESHLSGQTEPPCY